MCVFINLYYFCRQHTKKCIYCIFRRCILDFIFASFALIYVLVRTDTNLHKCIYDKKKYNKTKEYYIHEKKISENDTFAIIHKKIKRRMHQKMKRVCYVMLVADSRVRILSSSKNH